MFKFVNKTPKEKESWKSKTRLTCSNPRAKRLKALVRRLKARVEVIKLRVKQQTYELKEKKV